MPPFRSRAALLPTLVTALVTVLLTALAACSAGPSEPTSISEQELAAIEDDSGFAWEKQPTPLELGVTHTQNSLDSHHADEATERGMKILEDDGAIWQNHHIMGFGTGNPEPSPGDYDWDTLDKRMELTEATGGKAMLTLCCAPDWMKGGEEDETDWSTLEDNPLPEHYGDFAELAAEAVKRYPQVERVLVWNELKGFYNQAANRWDYEGYTDFYNQVYTAVKAVRPDIQVGGPYVVLTSLDPGTTDASDQVAGVWGAADQRALDVVDYWLQHKVGGDFVAVDASTRPGTTRSPRCSTAPRSSPTWTGGSASAPTCRSGGPSSTPTSPRTRRRAPPARPAPPPPWPRWRRTRSPGHPARSCGARRATPSWSTPRCGPTAPRTTAGSRPRSPRRGSGWCRGWHGATSRSGAPPRRRWWCSAPPTARWW
ncbi:hypothetical protein BJF90_35640 [Pseudonocardia sp. CNS-004]|nr:hypothetical protein BJF90_35640 [Pseudonocardia sp. CNS-004]